MLRLSRLCPARPPFLNIRFTTPGHANPYFIDRTQCIDPFHPAVKLGLSKLPSFVSPQFTIRAFPNAILHEPVDFIPINPLLATRALTQKWQSNPNIACHEKKDMRKHTRFVAARQIADAHLAVLAQTGRRNLSLLFHTSKKATSKSSVIRRRLRSKLSTAIALVISRCADAVDPPTSPLPKQSSTPYPPLSLVYRPLSESERLVLQDWSYLVIPTIAVYRMPIPNLVQAVRKAFLSLSHQSLRSESLWSALPKGKEAVVHGRRPWTQSHPQQKRARPK